MHLNESQLILYLEGKISAEEKRAFEQHLSDCYSCTEQLADIYKLTKAVESTPTPALDKKYFELAKNIIPKESKTFYKRAKKKYFAVRTAFAAVAAVLVVGIAYLTFDKASDPSRYRTPSDKESFIELFPENETTLDKNTLNFSWTSVPLSIGYKFLLYDADGKMIWNNLTKDTSLSIAPHRFIESGSTYLWKIEIIFPDDTKQRSDLNVFHFSE